MAAPPSFHSSSSNHHHLDDGWSLDCWTCLGRGRRHAAATDLYLAVSTCRSLLYQAATYLAAATGFLAEESTGLAAVRAQRELRALAWIVILFCSTAAAECVAPPLEARHDQVVVVRVAAVDGSVAVEIHRGFGKRLLSGLRPACYLLVLVLVLLPAHEVWSELRAQVGSARLKERACDCISVKETIWKYKRTAHLSLFAFTIVFALVAFTFRGGCDSRTACAAARLVSSSRVDRGVAEIVSPYLVGADRAGFLKFGPVVDRLSAAVSKSGHHSTDLQIGFLGIIILCGLCYCGVSNSVIDYSLQKVDSYVNACLISNAVGLSYKQIQLVDKQLG